MIRFGHRGECNDLSVFWLILDLVLHLTTSSAALVWTHTVHLVCITDSYVMAVWRNRIKHGRRTNMQPKVSTPLTFLLDHVCRVEELLYVAGPSRLASVLTSSSFPHWHYLLLCPSPGLPQNKLGSYLESRVNDYLRRTPHPESGDVTIRVVHVSDKVVEVKPGMKSRWAQTEINWWPVV